MTYSSELGLAPEASVGMAPESPTRRAQPSIADVNNVPTPVTVVPEMEIVPEVASFDNVLGLGLASYAMSNICSVPGGGINTISCVPFAF
jgi:hypothetical protein